MPRKSIYDPFFCDLIIEHMKTGESFTSFAAKLEVSTSTLQRWRRKYAEFADACDIAAAKAQAYWETILHSAANGSIETIEEGKYKKWHAGMVTFLMASRFKDYRSTTDKQRVAMEDMIPWDSIKVSVDAKDEE